MTLPVPVTAILAGLGDLFLAPPPAFLSRTPPRGESVLRALVGREPLKPDGSAEEVGREGGRKANSRYETIQKLKRDSKQTQILLASTYMTYRQKQNIAESHTLHCVFSIDDAIS